MLPNMPSDPDDLLDASNSSLRTASALVGLGHECHALAHSRREMTWDHQGVTLHEFSPGMFSHIHAGNYREMHQAVREQEDFDLLTGCEYWIRYAGIVRSGFTPDIVDCRELDGIGFFLAHQRLLGCEEAAAPIITSCYVPGFLHDPANWVDAYQFHRYLAHSRELYQLAASDAVLVGSHYMRRTLEARLRCEAPQVCPPYLGAGELNDTLAPGTDACLLFWGRLCYSSGVLSLLKVCRYLWDEGLVFTVHLVGESEFFPVKGLDMATYIKGAYGQYVSRGLLKLSTGTHRARSICQVLEESKALIYPVSFDTTPESYLKAMSLGRPVIASDSGGQADLIESGHSGLVFHDLGQLERHVKTILKASASELEELGLGAKERVGSWCNPDASLHGRLAWYQSVIGKNARMTRQMFPNPANFDKSGTPPIPQRPVEPLQKDYGKGLLSVVIPCYNLGEFLRECVESVCRSRYRPIEMIVVDDASTDPLTRRVLDEFKDAGFGYPDVSLIVLRQQRNRGVEQVRNLGAESAKGEFLCFLDADDLVHTEYFSKCIEVLKRYSNVGFVGTWAREIGSGYNYRIVPNFDFPFSLLWNQAFSSSVLRRCAYRRGWVPTILEDYELWISIVEEGWAGVVVPQVLFFYRMRRHSRYTSGSSYEARIAYQLIVTAHAPTYRRFGDQLFLLLFQNFSHNAYENLDIEASPLKFWLKLPLEALKLLIPKKIRYRIRHRFRIPRGKNFLSESVRRLLTK